MKGSPSDPMCGFSATASSILNSYQVPFEYFDVFTDQEVREGVKEFFVMANTSSNLHWWRIYGRM